MVILWIKETDDTRKAVREKLQIRREMPPEVIEHMARIYDLPHGASPACGMSACSSEDARINMPKYKYFSFDNLIKLVKENSSSDNDTTIGISEYLLPAAKAVAKPNLCPACGTCRPSDT